MTITVIAGHGTTSVNGANGHVTYTPSSSFVGTDTFSYQICDGQPVCDTAVVSIVVTAPPTTPAPPVAGDNHVKTKPGVPVLIDVLGNDSDPDNDLDPGSLRIVTPPAHGTVTIDLLTLALVYTPDAGFGGLDTLSYEICDSQPVCTTANVTINVTLDTLAITGVDLQAPAVAGFASLMLGILALIFSAGRRTWTPARRRNV